MNAIGRLLCRGGWHTWGVKRPEQGAIIRKCVYCDATGQWLGAAP